MFNKIPVKKDYLLILAAIVLLLVCYEFAFKTTIDAWQTHVQLNNQLKQATNLGIQPDYLQRKNLNLDKIIDLYKADTASFRSNSINKISIIAEKENVKLSEVPLQDPVFSTDKLIIQKFYLEGDYFSLTKTLNTLQSTTGIGLIRSTSYKLTRGRGNFGDKKLIAEVYLEIAK
ncbi:hypothetical protein [Mucilaginibacter sp. UR6-11]|uniref:hypothetical protein n=1 Tax=Mucilaginibacter sp. UR6-11 TaxID=1435644 RepID=UPI001E379B63|nr:hypothetical protein [Mucilaginibacter sp. UR6-11]MCC8427237.1 hypothetical protein [Mucilaginibacter sp. UR6-11]